MAFAARCSKALLLVLVGGGALVEGARIKRHEKPGSTKYIAGVPVLNYHLAHGGKAQSADVAALQDEEEDWVVVVQPQTSNAEIRSICGYSKRDCKMVGHPSEGGVPFLEVRGTERDLAVVLEGSRGAAHFVEPNPRFNFIPDDNFNDDAGDEEEEGQVGVSSVPWGIERVGVSERPNQGRGINMYVLDTGIRATHEDFGGRVVPTIDTTSGSVVECNGALSCAGDKRGHGTHCAGTAAGRTFGIASQSSILSLKCLDDGGQAPWSWIIAAFDWVATKAVRPAVASCSLGKPGDEAAARVAVEAATRAGVIMVVAGGNSGVEACTFTPANVPSAITVGATNKGNKQAFFSNWGTCVDIWAPGQDITSASQKSDTGSAVKSGTSQACPHVSGGAALLLEKNPSLTPAQMVSQLLDNAMTDVIGSMKESDTNKLLWVGVGPPPDAPPTTAAPSCRRRVWCR